MKKFLAVFLSALLLFASMSIGEEVNTDSRNRDTQHDSSEMENLPSAEVTILYYQFFYNTVLLSQLEYLEQEDTVQEFYLGAVSALYILESIQKNVDITDANIEDVRCMTREELRQYLEDFCFEHTFTEYDDMICIEFDGGVLIRFHLTENRLDYAELVFSSIIDLLGEEVTLHFPFV